MGAIGLELSDAGIMAAVSSGSGPVSVDGDNLESPGVALFEKNQLLFGHAAAEKAHIHPRYIINAYWDQLDTKPLKTAGFSGKTHAELAYGHLKGVWNEIENKGDGVIISVPEYYTPQQLGLILGMAKELAVPVIGFVPMSMAASSTPYPQKLLVYVDMHLHRTFVTALSQDHRLFTRHTETLPDHGIYSFYSKFAAIIAAAFVQQTRYDPFHQAASEQHLYDRLPGLIARLQEKPTAPFHIQERDHIHRIELSQELFLEKIKPAFNGVWQIIEGMRNDFNMSAAPVVVQVSHRANRIFGFNDLWADRSDIQVVVLDPGAAAVGALQLVNQFENRTGISLLSSRPWIEESMPQYGEDPTTRPSHLLFRNIAYPISVRSLAISMGRAAYDLDIIYDDSALGAEEHWCIIQLEGEDVMLTVNRKEGIYIDGVPVTGKTTLFLGQIIQIGTGGAELRLITCKKPE